MSAYDNITAFSGLTCPNHASFPRSHQPHNLVPPFWLVEGGLLMCLAHLGDQPCSSNKGPQPRGNIDQTFVQEPSFSQTSFPTCLRACRTRRPSVPTDPPPLRIRDASASRLTAYRALDSNAAATDHTRDRFRLEPMASANQKFSTPLCLPPSPPQGVRGQHALPLGTHGFPEATGTLLYTLAPMLGWNRISTG